MEDILEKTLLLDYYGVFLTDKQAEMYRMRYEEDLSLAEISRIFNISRQSASDTIKNAERALENFELRLGLIQKYSKLDSIIGSLDYLLTNSNDSIINANDIIKIKKELEEIRR